MTVRHAALRVVDELRSAGRMTTVEVRALREGLDPINGTGVMVAEPSLVVANLRDAGSLCSIEDIFEALGGPAKFGAIIGKSTEYASSMRRRNSVPLRYWPAVIKACREIGLELDEATLGRLHVAPEHKTEAA